MVQQKARSSRKGGVRTRWVKSREDRFYDYRGMFFGRAKPSQFLCRDIDGYIAALDEDGQPYISALLELTRYDAVISPLHRALTYQAITGSLHGRMLRLTAAALTKSQGKPCRAYVVVFLQHGMSIKALHVREMGSEVPKWRVFGRKSYQKWIHAGCPR